MDSFNVSTNSQKALFYTVLKEVPTLRNLLAVPKEDMAFDCSHKFSRQTLLSIGFVCKKKQDKPLNSCRKKLMTN